VQDEQVSALVWLLLAVALCAGELFTLDLVLLMLAGAALAGAGTAVVTDSLTVQVVVAGVTAVALLAVVRPVARRHLTVPALPAGRERLHGRTAVVVQAVGADSGQVRLDGELWRARPYSGGPDVAAGQTVVVAQVDGATLHVYPQELP
jgi:membrane protein implicated in regulation of membrane protease activity